MGRKKRYKLEEGYKKLEKPLLLQKAVMRFGVERLHPLDWQLWKEVPEENLKTALVTMIKA